MGMEDALSRLLLHRIGLVAVSGITATMFAGSAVTGAGVTAALPVAVPSVTDFQLLTASITPPSEAACFAVNRRCFTASAMENAYNLPPLYAAGDEGQGVTIAIIDSFGNPNMESDLANFDMQMKLPHMCGEPGAAC